MKYTIYQDLDGCLVDFDMGFYKLSGGYLPSEFENKFGKKEFWKLITNKGASFWEDLEWMPDGKILWNYIKQHNPIILSAPSSHPSSYIGKKNWMKEHLPGVELILAERKNKQKYASSYHILIDDNEKTNQEWKSSGGINIYHISANETILYLKEYGL